MGHVASKCLTQVLSLLLGVAAACAPFPLDSVEQAGGKSGAERTGALRPLNEVSKQKPAKSIRPNTPDTALNKSTGTSSDGRLGVPPTISEPSPLEPIEDVDEEAAEAPAGAPLPSLARPQPPPRDGKVVADDVTIAQRSDSQSADAATKSGLSVLQLPLEDVFFRFDSVAIDDAGKQALHTNAGTVKNVRMKRIVVEGHCDERGSAAYNLVLGEKRAAAIEHYFSELGIDPAAIETVSYGKERPFCRQRDEACYQQNRRGHIWMEAEVSSGSLTSMAE